MDKNRFIIENCPNFYKIVNYNIDKDDLISEKLISIYKNYIFRIDLTTREEQTLLKELDYVLSKYIDDYEFRKSLVLRIPEMNIYSKKDLIKAFISGILDIYNDYLDGTTRKIHIARWI